MIYDRFLEPEARKAFFDCYKEIEAFWEILSPSPELRDHIATFKRLAQLYAAVRNAYANKVGYEADLTYKTRRLIQENATQEGLGRPRKWGSCSSRGTITLAADLIERDGRFQDFVVAHELLHLRVPNRGRLFKGVDDCPCAGLAAIRCGALRRALFIIPVSYADLGERPTQ